MASPKPEKRKSFAFTTGFDEIANFLPDESSPTSLFASICARTTRTNPASPFSLSASLTTNAATSPVPHARSAVPSWSVHCPRRIPVHAIVRLVSAAEIPILRRPIMRPPGGNLLWRPANRPPDLAFPYPIVRLACEAPVPDRGVERNRLAVKNELPISGTERGNDLFSASAATLVNHGRVFHRHVERPLFRVHRG